MFKVWEPGERKVFDTEELLCIDDATNTWVDVTVEVDYEENFTILQYHFGSADDLWTKDSWDDASPEQVAELESALRQWVDNKVDSMR